MHQKMEPNLQSKSKRNWNQGFVAHSPEQFRELTGFETGTERVLHVLSWLISWSRNYYKELGREFCLQHVLTIMNTLRKADGASLESHGSLHWFSWGGFCLSFVFLRGRRLLCAEADPFALLSSNQESSQNLSQYVCLCSFKEKFSFFYN